MSLTFEIASSISVPKRTGRPGGRPMAYPFEAMTDGDCLLTPVPQDPTPENISKLMKRVRSAAQAWKKRAGVTCGFVVKVVTEGEHAGKVGCWKVAGRTKKAEQAA